MTRTVFLATIPFGVISLALTFFLHEITDHMSNETVFGVQRDTGVHDADDTKPVAQQYEQASQEK